MFFESRYQIHSEETCDRSSSSHRQRCDRSLGLDAAKRQSQVQLGEQGRGGKKGERRNLGKREKRSLD